VPIGTSLASVALAADESTSDSFQPIVGVMRALPQARGQVIR
jgi:hypothetical protein